MRGGCFKGKMLDMRLHADVAGGGNATEGRTFRGGGRRGELRVVRAGMAFGGAIARASAVCAACVLQLLWIRPLYAKGSRATDDVVSATR